MGASDDKDKGASPKTRIVQPMSFGPKPNSALSAALHRIIDCGRVAVTLLLQFFPASNRTTLYPSGATYRSTECHRMEFVNVLSKNR